MKKMVFNVSDEFADLFLGVAKSFAGVELLSVDETEVYDAIVEKCVAIAIREMRDDDVIKRPSDYTYIMLGANDGAIPDIGKFDTPSEFIKYLGLCQLDDLPGRNTLYDTIAITFGKYPEWTFRPKRGVVSRTEEIRRKNIVKRFLSAYIKAKMMYSGR